MKKNKSNIICAVICIIVTLAPITLAAFGIVKNNIEKKDEEALMKVKPMKSFRLLVTKPEVADKVLARLHQLIDIKTQPKDIVMPIRAAMDAGAIRRPTWEEFCKEFGNDKISGKSSLSDYTNPEKQPYAGSAFSAMIDEFRKMIL
jgi:hypothetical protein